jgi:coenzyme F420 hydrogenase subunit beta
MIDVAGEGLRPKFPVSRTPGDPLIAACPGFTVDSRSKNGTSITAGRAKEELGSVLEIWEGYAADPEIRFRASSGGLLTALSLYCLESGRFRSVVHSGMDPDKPWGNKTFITEDPAELPRRCGSRYAPSSPCEGLGWLEDRQVPAVFIGKPCDASAVQTLCRMDGEVRDKIGLILSFFCAGTPSTQGTLDLIDGLGGAPAELDEVHYRGEGWPGRFRLVPKKDSELDSLSYMEAWGRLTGYRPLRCNLCPDGLGRLADITCGDAWHRFQEGSNDPGRSIALIRTERGRELFRAARDAGYIVAEPLEAEQVIRAQDSLLQRRRELFGRLLAFRLLGLPTPRYPGFSLFRSWMRLGPLVQAKTVLGTWRRILRKGWHKKRRDYWD